VIFSIEKWFTRYLNINKWLGRTYKLILNLCVLFFLVVLIYSCIKLFKHTFNPSALIGSLIVLFEIAFTVWLFSIIVKQRRRWPSMKLTLFSLAVIFIVMAFAGVQPISAYKDNTIGFFKNLGSNAETSSNSTSSLKTEIGTWPTGTPIPQVTAESVVKTSSEAMPPQDTWNFKIQTSTYSYYAKSCWKADTTTIIKGYWSGTEKKWNWHDGYMVFTRQAYGTVEIILKDVAIHYEKYISVTGGLIGGGKGTYQTLYTDKSWTGSLSKKISYHPSQAPWVVNAGYTPTSKLGSKFEIYVWKELGNGIQESATEIFGRNGTFKDANGNDLTAMVVEDIGNYTIDITASGCDWWVKIGVEK